MFQVALFLSKPSTRAWDTNGCAITIQRMYGDIDVVTTFSDIRTLVVVCLHATAYVHTYVRTSPTSLQCCQHAFIVVLMTELAPTNSIHPLLIRQTRPQARIR